MYSYEIDNLLKSKNYTIDSDTYTNICKSSPQVKRVKYEPVHNSFEIRTDDGFHWKFVVYPAYYEFAKPLAI